METKRPAGRAGRKTYRAAGSDRLGQLNVRKLDWVGVIALLLLLAVALVQDVVDLVDEQVHGFVHFLGLGGAIDIGAPQLDMGLGGKFVRMVVLAVTFKLDANPHDMGLVAKQSLQLLLEITFEGWSEFEVNAGHDDLVGFIRMVHGSPWVYDAKGVGGSASSAVPVFLAAVLQADRLKRYSERNRFIRLG
jgi:hypothetical protein